MKQPDNLHSLRFWIATFVVLVLVIAVWKFVDFRMRPPPPPSETEQVSPGR